MKALRFLSFLLSVVAGANVSTAQYADHIWLLRSEDWQQLGPDSFVPLSSTPFRGRAVLHLPGAGLRSATVAVGDALRPLVAEDGIFLHSSEYPSMEALLEHWPAGVYTFSGVAGEAEEAFSFDVTLGDHITQTVPRILNWEDLQSVDPDAPLRVEWPRYLHDGDVCVIWIHIGYPTDDAGGYAHAAWSPASNRGDGLPGMRGDTTSIEIPAGVLEGSYNGRYDLTVEFISLYHVPSPEPFPAAKTYRGATSRTLARIHVAGSDPDPEFFLSTWPILSGWAGTGAWLDWLWVGYRPWVFSVRLDKYAYVAEETHTASGAWVYIPDFTPNPEPSAEAELYLATWPIEDGWASTEDWLDWLWVGHRPWVLSARLSKYLYVAEDSHSPSGAWVYVPHLPEAES